MQEGIPVLGPLLAKIVGTRNERFVKRYTNRVDQIGALEAQTRPLTDAQLREKTVEFRERFAAGESEEKLLVEVFAVAREAMDRNVGIRNIFNPEHAFDASRLPEYVRATYEQIKSELDGAQPMPPEGDLRGNEAPVPAWVTRDLPNELYEAVRELYPESKPPFRARPFDVQLIGGMVLAAGKIAEMKTGEGKTIVAPLASYLACCKGMQVHVVTVNDYLVQRDRDWVFPFFRALGLTVGAIHPHHMQDERQKREMYLCDAVYGTTAEFGFDYLRDNMKRSVEQQVQRKRQFAVVDEVDSTLIDEARTPLIISGPAHDDQPRYEMADELARKLVELQKPWQELDDRATAIQERIKGLEGDVRQVRDKARVPEIQKEIDEARAELPRVERERDRNTQYYEVRLERKQCHLTHEGIAEAQKLAGVGSFYVDENMDIPHLLSKALLAYAVYERDRDYVVMDVPDRATGRTEATVVIVDTNTGRPMIGRQWSDGLHQAMEVKERVPVKQETQTVASITIQNYFKMYKRLSGMTGTADTEAQEFNDIYSLDVVGIPTNKPVVRVDSADMMFLRERDKWEHIVDEIKRFHDVGRPILVGTTSVEKSEVLSQMLTRKYGIQHEVLNAKQHEREAHIVEHAGHIGAVMIATNMAGRGTDIKLGKFERKELLEHWQRRGVCPKDVTVDTPESELRAAVFRKVAQSELELKKREVEAMDDAELERKILEHKAFNQTWLSEKQISGASNEELMEALDESHRAILHRIRWFENIQDMGGLHVIGTERHEARRIDNQLRGRSGRQGDNGSSRFFVSCEDDLMRMFAGETLMKLLPRLGLKEGDAIESAMLSKRIEGAQRKVEERNFQIRKNLLEYDEIKEHQRQDFYGLRQRVLEGRDVKGLIFEFLEAVAQDACDEFLAPNYAALCAAEYAKERLDFTMNPDRLKNKELDDMEVVIRRDAVDDAGLMIDVTLGEYMPTEGSEVSMDFDAEGLKRWASSRFGVELSDDELQEASGSVRREVADRLLTAAKKRIDATDLSGLALYVDVAYGAKEMADWARAKFGFDVEAEEILEAHNEEGRSARDVLLDKANELYAAREVEYPVDFAMEMTMVSARQDPMAAMTQLATWANRRFGLDWTADTVRAKPPAQIRDDLVEHSRRFVEENRLQAAIDEALAVKDDWDALDAQLSDRYGSGVTEAMRLSDPDEREDVVRARVENILRSELLYLERTILLDLLDSIWKDHLYAMDQLQDGISFRAVSQQDPRIAFKREGARLFADMKQTIRDRITDYIFKARVSPAAQFEQQQQQQRLAAQRQAATGPQGQPVPGGVAVGGAGGGAGGGMYGGGIAGPSFGEGPQASPPATKQAATQAASGQATSSDQGGSSSEEPAPGAEDQLNAARAAREQDRGKSRKR